MPNTAENLPMEQSHNLTPSSSLPIPQASLSLFMDVQRFEHMQRVAKMFSASTMVPDHFRNNVGNCAIALNLANNMQVDPFMLMQNMYIVQGKPGIEAKLVIAILNRSGKFSPLQFKLEGEGMARKCTAYAKHTSTGEVCSQTVSMEMAKAEGWIDKKGSKWKTMPDLMLQYRSAMFFARLYHPEALFGMQSTEELQDITMVRRPDGAYEAAAEHSGLSEMIAAKKSDNAQAEPAANCPPEWDRTVWINKRSAGFADYVDNNRAALKNCTEEIQQEVRAKFTGMYPSFTFPGDYPPMSTPTEAPDPQANPNPQQQAEPAGDAPAKDVDVKLLVSQMVDARNLNTDLYYSALKALVGHTVRPGIPPKQMTAAELVALRDEINRRYPAESAGPEPTDKPQGAMSPLQEAQAFSPHEYKAALKEFGLSEPIHARDIDRFLKRINELVDLANDVK